MSSICRFYSVHKLGYFVILQTNRSAFLKRHQVPSRSLKGSFSGKSVRISDCQAFSPFKTLPGCLAFRHLLNREKYPFISRHPRRRKTDHLEIRTHICTVTKVENCTAKVGQDNVNTGVVTIFRLANTSLLQVY